MSKRKRPKEEFLADLRPLKRRLTWKDAINRVFKEYPNGFLMGKDQIKNEFLSIHKIDKLKIESPNERIEDEFEKKLKEFTDEDILFENQNVYTINPQISTTQIPSSQIDNLLTNEEEKTESASSNEKMLHDLEKIEKEIDETYSHEEEEISDEEEEDVISPNEAIKLILNEKKPNEKFLSSNIQKTMEKKIERKEIILEYESALGSTSSSLNQLLSTNWKTDSGNVLFKRKITKKEKEIMSANRNVQNIYWLGKQEDKVEEEEEEEINNPNYKSIEESIEEILQKNGRLMSTNQISNSSHYSNSTIHEYLPQLIKKYSSKSFGVKRIKLDKEIRKRWKRKHNSYPNFLYYYQQKGDKEQEIELEEYDLESKIKEILKDNNEEMMSSTQIYKELVSKKGYSISKNSFINELGLIVKKSNILRRIPLKDKKLKKKWKKNNKEEKRTPHFLYFIKKKITNDSSQMNQEISNEEEEEEDVISPNEAIKLILNEMSPNEKFLSFTIKETLEKKIKRKEIIFNSEISSSSINLSRIPSSNWKTDSGYKLFTRKITKEEKEIMSVNRKTQNIYWLGEPEEEDNNNNYKSSEESIEEILRKNGKLMSSNQISKLSQIRVGSISPILSLLIKEYSSKDFGVKRIKLNKEMKKRWRRKYKTSSTFLYYYQEKGSEEQKELEQDFDNDVIPIELEIKEILKNNEEGMNSNQIYKELVSKKIYSKPNGSFNNELNVIIKKSDILRKVPCEGKLKKKWLKKNKDERKSTKFLYFLKKKKKKKRKKANETMLQKQIEIPPPPPSSNEQQIHHHEQSLFFDCFENLNVLTISPKTKITKRNGFNILDIIEEKKTKEISTKTEIIEYFEKISHVKIFKTIKCHISTKQNFNKLKYLKKIRFNELLFLEEIQQNNYQNGITEINLIYESFGTCGIEISKLNKKQIKILIKKTLKNIQNLLNLGISCFINISDIFYKITEKEKEVKFLLWNNFEFCNFGEICDERFLTHLKRFFNNLFLLIGIKDVFNDLNQYNNFNEVFRHVNSVLKK